MNNSPHPADKTSSQFTLLRLLIATAWVAAVVVTVRRLTSGNLLMPPTVFVVVGFSGALILTTLRGAWLESLSVALLLFPPAWAAAIAPWSMPLLLLASLATIGLLLLARRLARKRTTP